MATVPTRESIAARDAELLRPSRRFAEAESSYTRILTSPLLHKLVYLAGDLLAITLAHMLAFHFVEHFLGIGASAINPFEYHRVYIAFFAPVLYLFDGYKSPELRRPEQELEKSCKAVMVGFLGLVLFNFVVYRAERFSRYLFVIWFGLACVLLVATRFSLRALHERLWKAGLCRKRALLMGSAAEVSGYRQLLSVQRHHGYELVGVLTNADKLAPGSGQAVKIDLTVLGSIEQWENAVKITGAQALILAAPTSSLGDTWLRELLSRCKELRVDVELYSEVLATANLNYEHDEFSGCFRYYPRSQWSVTAQRVAKRGIDIVVGLIGSVVTLLLMPIVWVLVNLEDRGPVFYLREFVGTDGKIHYYRKFRTMLNDADEILRRDAGLKVKFLHKHKLEDDPRLLRSGRFMRRFSLDEFPQFFSVLSGKLTFVGPRVISGEERQRYGTLLPKLLSSKPGLTGFWQVTGRQTTTYEERVQMDMFYIDRWSIWLDLVIIAKTFWKVLKTEGAY